MRFPLGLIAGNGSEIADQESATVTLASTARKLPAHSRVAFESKFELQPNLSFFIHTHKHTCAYTPTHTDTKIYVHERERARTHTHIYYSNFYPNIYIYILLFGSI